MRYRKLLAHDAAVRLSAEVEKILPAIEAHDPDLARHIRKTVGSIEDNTAEAGDASTPGRIVNSFRIAKASCAELDNQLSRAVRWKYVTAPQILASQLVLRETVFYLAKLIDKWNKER